MGRCSLVAIQGAFVDLGSTSAVVPRWLFASLWSSRPSIAARALRYGSFGLFRSRRGDADAAVNQVGAVQ